MCQLYSAGIDVYPDEPNVNPKLIAMDNITLLPHMGTETRDSQKKVGDVGPIGPAVTRTDSCS